MDVIVGGVDTSMNSELIEAEAKWAPLCRRHFQIHFREWKRLNFD